MRCDETQEFITARVDDEIDGDTRIAVDDHLKSCSACARAFAQESLLKRRIRLSGRQISAPTGLRRAIEEKATAPAQTAAPATPGFARYAAVWVAIKSIATARGRRKTITESKLPTLRRAVEEEATAPVPVAPAPEPHAAASAATHSIATATRRWRIFTEANLPALRRTLLAAVVLVVVASVILSEWRTETQDSIAVAALDSHAAIVSGKSTLLRAVNLAAMRKELAQAVGDRFKPVVLDLSLIKLYPMAGFVQNAGGRDLLVTVYQGDGAPITCFTFLGSEADAPQGAERFYDAEKGINYYSFSRGDLNGVLHQEGEVICLLVSTMAPADLLALVRGRSAHA